ncbi:wall-associated receptor kinase 5-like [Rutidosis leptorrhynchoides]|uniref:wall-associated receptor kinase 5-like n=1 Tax=Rutidosis leptorrhynchoides TaxID=125765 RepID=UPI003A9957B9
MAFTSFPLAKPGCNTQCGNLTVGYPFGIGVDLKCSIGRHFDLTCNSTHYDPPKLFIGLGNLEVWNITDDELRINPFVAYKCYDEYGNVTQDETSLRRNLGSLTYSFSQKNKFTVIGCDDFAIINGTDNEGAAVASGCFGFCNNPNDVPDDGNCSGLGCCETSIPKGLKYITSTLSSFNNHTSVHGYDNNCGLTILGEDQSFKFHGAQDLKNATELFERITSNVPTVLEWVIRDSEDCSECKGDTTCIHPDIGGYRCGCKEGYEGNPYLDPGCQDINECEVKGKCYGRCNNTVGRYICTCPQGYEGNATILDGCQPVAKPSKGSNFSVLTFILALVFSLVVIVCGVTAILFGIRKKNIMKLREKFFEKNGGTFLKQKIDAPGIRDAVIMFSAEQLWKATDNYSEERVIGQGGYGVVFKGILADKSVVAVKKSKLIDGTQTEQFINEVLILTQIIHRNVVKLLGFCLEEEVPVLVYEFIANNTLYYHLHYELGGMSWLSWDNRLRVATESADALGYLHSQATMPIIHRDVKSTNILLDENYTTKISDFGASRLVPLDHDQVTTLVQGTLGYLDPEYFHTSQLTEKSDVYSFGVVLAELITGQKPLCANRTNEEKNLATYFVRAMKENCLFEIVEPRILREGTFEQIQQVADLAKRCVNLQGIDRPTMKEVAMELENLKKSKTHPWVQQQTNEESKSLILEIERSDLYEVPLIPYASSEWESHSGSSNFMGLPDNKPR